MNTLPLSLSPERAARLLDYIQMYRRHLLTQVFPSAGRNTNQRLLQALEGKLLNEHHIQQEASSSLTLTREERDVLVTMVIDLRTLITNESERNATQIDLIWLKTTFGLDPFS